MGGSWSGEKDGRNFYSRANQAVDGAGFDLRGPQEAKDVFDPVVNKLVKSFKAPPALTLRGRPYFRPARIPPHRPRRGHLSPLRGGEGKVPILRGSSPPRRWGRCASAASR